MHSPTLLRLGFYRTFYKSAFTLGVEDSSVESLYHHTSHLRLKKLTYHEDFNVELTFT